MSQKSPQIQNPPGTGRRSRRNRGGPNQGSFLDVNPQFLNMTVTESAPNTFTSASFATPVSLQTPSGHALVMEILKVFSQIGSVELIVSAATLTQWALSRKALTSLADLEHPDVICTKTNGNTGVGARTAEATGVSSQAEREHCYDLTDGNGNGILFAGASLYVSAKGAGNVGAKKVSLKVLYRLKMVAANELIGMLRD